MYVTCVQNVCSIDVFIKTIDVKLGLINPAVLINPLCQKKNAT